MEHESAEALTPRGEKWVSIVQRPLDLLALLFLVCVVLLWSFPGAPRGVIDALNAFTWIVWGVFALDYVVRLVLAVDTWRFVRTHKLDLLMVVVPMLRLLRVFLLIRRSLSAVSTERIAGSIVSIVVGVVVVAAFLEWRIEYDAPGATITTFRQALWWAIVTTTTVGYGDYTPVTQAGRAVAAVVMVVGIGLIGTISATVAAWFVSRPAAGTPESEGDAELDIETAEDTHAQLLARLDALSTQQDEIRTMLATLQPPPRP